MGNHLCKLAGTTRRVAAPLTHAAKLANAWGTAQRLGIGPNHRWTSIVPPFHCAGCIMNLLACPAADDPERLTTVGPPLPGFELRITDPADRKPLAPGRTGQIEARGTMVMRGYHRMAAAPRLTGRVGMAELRDHCAGRIAGFKVPEAWFAVTGFPMTASGKIQKYRLRELAAENALEVLP